MSAVRLRLRRPDFDEYGFLRDLALHRLRGLLWDAPCVPVVIDLGPCQHQQDLLLRDLAQLRCAPAIRFEARDWRVVRDHRDALARELDAAA